MSIKIRISELNNKKPFFVETTNSNMRKVLEFQLMLSKVDDLTKQLDEDEGSVSATQVLTKRLEVLDNTLSFINGILNLTKEQYNRLDHIEQEDTLLLANRISMRMNGQTEQEIKETLEGDADEGKE